MTNLDLLDSYQISKELSHAIPKGSINTYRLYGLYGDFIKEIPAKETLGTSLTLDFKDKDGKEIRPKIESKINIDLPDINNNPINHFESLDSDLLKDTSKFPLDRIRESIDLEEFRIITNYLSGLPSSHLMNQRDRDNLQTLNIVNGNDQLEESRNLYNEIIEYGLNDTYRINKFLLPHHTRHVASWQSSEEINNNSVVRYKNFPKHRDEDIFNFVDTLANKTNWSENYGIKFEVGEFAKQIFDQFEGYVFIVHTDIAKILRNQYLTKHKQYLEVYDMIKAEFDNTFVGIHKNIFVIENELLPKIYIKPDHYICRGVLLGKNALATCYRYYNDENASYNVTLKENEDFTDVNIAINKGFKVIQLPELSTQNNEKQLIRKAPYSFVDCGRVHIDIALHSSEIK